MGFWKHGASSLGLLGNISVADPDDQPFLNIVLELLSTSLASRTCFVVEFCEGPVEEPNRYTVKYLPTPLLEIVVTDGRQFILPKVMQEIIPEGNSSVAKPGSAHNAIRECTLSGFDIRSDSFNVGFV